MTREDLLTTSVCLLLVVGALAVAAWALITGQVANEGLDGVFLLIVCATIALVFSVIPLRALRQLKRPRKTEEKA